MKSHPVFSLDQPIPRPQNHKHQLPRVLRKLSSARASLGLAALLIAVFYVSAGFSFGQPHGDWVRIFALHNSLDHPPRALMQLVSHIFIHFDLAHLASNVLALVMLSVYERQVGARRFLMVFSLSALVAGLSVTFYDSACVSSGASGGLFGLAAAYFGDQKGAHITDWKRAAVFGAVILALFFVYVGLSNALAMVSTDHYAHALGAAAGLLSVWALPIKSSAPTKKDAPVKASAPFVHE